MGDVVYSMKGWNYKLYYLMKANGAVEKLVFKSKSYSLE